MLHRLSDINAEVLAPAILKVIDGLYRGNVFEFVWYERVLVWGDAVRKFLLSD